MGREQERVQAEENTVIHHSTTTIDTGHTHLQKGGENDKLGGGGYKVLPLQIIEQKSKVQLNGLQ